ncbi:MAG TPA: heme ABC exporter ATP-binding protein CcmA [Longimicrobiaceae bacterium]|nr:heme ABC exporter ATP-binding protein CcmA [Longimicrobiaceae bacterium]
MSAPAAAPAIEARGVEKWYGPLPAVRGVSFELRAGEFLALFGPNGAGKTTLLKILAGIVRPTRGEVRVAGEAVRGGDGEWRRRIGVLSHQTFLYAGLTAAENLEFYARLYTLDRRRERVEAGLRDVGLWERRGDRVRGFSRGMQQRLALARTLLHDPRVVLLDEPYTGLDPHAAAMLRGTLERLRDGTRTVVLVTHNLSRGLELADRVVVQAGGRWVSDEPRAAVDAARWERTYTERVAGAA